MTTELTNREIADVARIAAEIIQQRGKATGTYEDDSGRVCTVGAIMRAARIVMQDDFRGIIMRDELTQRCIATLGQRPTSLAAWSDLPTTTEQDIAKVFLQVADDVEVAP